MASLVDLPIGITRVPPRPRAEASFNLSIDEGARIIRTAGQTLSTVAQADDYLAELGGLIAECRRRFGRARVLADRRSNPIQSDAVAERLGEASAVLLTEQDRLAVVVDSSIAKSRVRRGFTRAGSHAFLSYAAAELWLTAWP